MTQAETVKVDRRHVLTAGLALTATAASAGAVARKVSREPVPGNAALRLPVRLAANENPWGPGPAARAALAAAVDESSRYGMAQLGQLTEAICRREGVDKDRVIVGMGSGELLNLLAFAYADRGQIVCAWPTFNFLMSYGEKLGAEIRKVPLDAELRHDLPALDAAVNANSSLLYVCNPNNPTGTVIAGAALRSFCSQAARRTLVVVDEAYLELADDGATESMVDLARAGENVIVLRTFSKLHGLAGLRVGYGIARPDVIQRIRRYQMTIGSLPGYAAAAASLADTDFLTRTRATLIADRRRVLAACDELGLRHAAPSGNFVFMKVGMPFEQFRTRMREQQVQLGQGFEPYSDWSRVSIGTTIETTFFIDALRRVIKA